MSYKAIVSTLRWVMSIYWQWDFLAVSNSVQQHSLLVFPFVGFDAQGLVD